MRRRRGLGLLVALLAPLLGAGCGGGIDLRPAAEAPRATTTPPEEEGGAIDVVQPPTTGTNPYGRLAPAAHDETIYVLNPDAALLVAIDARDLSVRSRRVDPEPVSLVVDADGAPWVLSWGTHVLQRIDVASGYRFELPVRETVNRARIHPTGAFLLLNTDPDRLPAGSDPLPTLSDHVWYDPALGRSGLFSSGEPPRAIAFDQDPANPKAVILTPRTLVVLAPRTDPEPRVYTLAITGTTEELFVAPDGTRAWIRFADATALWQVDLANGATAAVTMPTRITDLDATPDGRYLVVVARGSTSWLRRIDTTTGYGALVSFPTTLGQAEVAPDGETILLYTNAADSNELVRYDVAGGQRRTIRLPKWLAQVVMAPEARYALVLHREGGLDPVFDYFEGIPTLSVVDTETGRFTPLALPEEPATLLFPAATTAFLVFPTSDDALAAVDLPGQVISFAALPGRPLHSGVLPSGIQDWSAAVWVLGDHPLGQISFAGLPPGRADLAIAVRTLTGFDLNARLEGP